MLKKLLSLSTILASVALAACGGGGNTITDPGGGGAGGGGGGSTAASVQVLASSPQLGSDQSGLSTVDITAIVRDSNNVVLPGQTVSFGANSNGSLSVINAVTDDNGQALARLGNGSDISNRVITVTASTGGASGSVTVNVTGTRLRLTPPSATLSLGDAVGFTAILEDSAGAGVSGQAVNISSAQGNSLSSSNLTTGLNGQVQFTLTASQSGDDTLSASALGVTAQAAVVVAGDDFRITVPDETIDVQLGVEQTVTAVWMIDGDPQAGETIQFTTTRGLLNNGLDDNWEGSISVDTNGGGQATVLIRSMNAGPALITASTSTGAVTTRSVEFVATTAASLDLQAEPFTVRVGGQSAITAIVRDPNGNLVKNKVVSFQIFNDTTNSSLSVSQDTTDSQGRATTFFNAGSVASAHGGIELRAVVLDTPAVWNSVNLTVAGQALAISLGTGNDLFEIGTATFAKEWVIFVTDADGAAVANKAVQASVVSINYKKGRFVVPMGGTKWEKGSPEAICPDEDLDPKNGILDPGEDLNGNDVLDAGNIALVAAVPNSAPSGNPCGSVENPPTQSANVVTDNQGRARVCVFYPQNYNQWLDVRITARASVAGTETAKSQTFELEALASDMTNINASPPGAISPFGLAANDADCTVDP